jgi:polyphenol oxidase
VRLPEPFRAEGEHIGIELPGARTVFTTRRGGCSSGPYASLNLGRWTDDDALAVERNRRAVERHLGVQLAFVRQVHGASVRRVMRAGRDRSTLQEGDGLLTSLPAIAPMVLTADCLPIAVAGGGAVAMLHAGWRGLAAGVVAAGVAAIRELAGSDQLAAAIGPGAGRCCYEVSDDVRGVFAAFGARVHAGRQLDLKTIARQQLERAGVSQVHDVGLCTICSDPTLFFSHRRDGGITGRQAGIAWLN